MKVGLIGLGRMGMRHAEALEMAGLSVGACADMDQSKHADAAKSFNIDTKFVFADGLKLIEQYQPDLLVIATTAPSHKILVVQAAKFNVKKILCEKPMAPSLADCQSMIEACEASGTTLAINHQMRFMEQYTLPKELINSEQFGGLSSMIVSAGNFGMAMNGTHYFEAFRYMVDAPVESVNAWFDETLLANPRGDQFEDASGSIRLQSTNGKRFVMDCSGDQGHGMFVTYNCPQGRIEIDELAGSMKLTYREAEHRDQPTTRYGMPYKVEVRDIVPADATAPTKSVLDCLLADGNFPNGNDGMVAMRLLIAAHRSHQANGSTISVDEMTIKDDLTLPIA